MKEITILSGKGGTGKTTITAAIASMAKKSVFCDNDVDAADLHLLLKPTVKEEYSFNSGWDVSIDPAKCAGCGLCKRYCRFDAIHTTKDNEYSINPYQCEGCLLCERICPAQAITSKQNSNNYWYVSDTRFGPLVHAKMGPGEENSGKLVTQVRKKAKEIARQNQADYIINDGPPGIGCAAIASVTGTDEVLVVMEPTKSGLHDAQRLVELVQSFKIPVKAIINKDDINQEMANEIEQFFKRSEIQIIGSIPFDHAMTESMVRELTITEYQPKSLLSQKINNIWDKIKADEVNRIS
ncbi:MAG: P-loop NTPase [Bacteroidota bacterium]